MELTNPEKRKYNLFIGFPISAWAYNLKFGFPIFRNCQFNFKCIYVQFVRISLEPSIKKLVDIPIGGVRH